MSGRETIVTLPPATAQFLRMAVDLQALQMIMVGIAAGLLLLFIISTFQRPRHRYPQGPRPFPILGNVGILRNLHADPDRQLLRLRDRWGSMCMLWYGSSPVIIVNSPKAAREMLNERSAIYSSRPEPNEFRKKLWPWRLVSTPANNDDFRFLRRLYHNCLSPQQALPFRKYQDFESKVTLQSLLDEPGGFLKSAERYTMSVIFSAVYGVRLDRLDHPILVELNGLLDETMKYFEPGKLLIDFVPFLQYLPLALQPWHQRLAPLVERELALHFAFLKTLRKALEAGRRPDCFGKMLIEVQQREKIVDRKAIHILAMLIGAGSEPTGTVLQGFFQIVALNQPAIQKAQAELDRVVGSERMPTWNDEPSLPYVRSLIKEIHRYNPIASLGVPHCAMKNDTYEGHEIPKGTIVFPNLTALSKDPDRYPDPDAFDPDRFQHDNKHAAVSALSKDHLERDHFHYGFGRRLCPGVHVAEASLFIFISRILWGFHIEPKQGCPLDIAAKTALLINKPKPYEVDILCRGPSYEKIIREGPGDLDTGVPSLDHVMENLAEAESVK